jgi:hypothetical protein
MSIRADRKASRKYYDKNREKILENVKKRVLTDEQIEKNRIYQREYYLAHKDKFKTYYKRNRKRMLKASRKRYEEHREEICQYQREYRLRNLEKIKLYQKNKKLAQKSTTI